MLPQPHLYSQINADPVLGCEIHGMCTPNPALTAYAPRFWPGVKERGSVLPGAVEEVEGKAGQIDPRRWHEAGFAPELRLQALSAFSVSPSDFTYRNKDKII